MFKRFFKWLKKLFTKVKEEVRPLIPIAVKIVEGIKTAVDSEVVDVVTHILTTAIPGDADDKLVKKITNVVEKVVPQLLLQLKLVESIMDIDDINEQLKAIVRELKLSSDEVKSAAYSGLALLILESLADNKLTLAESVEIAKYYKEHFVKK